MASRVEMLSFDFWNRMTWQKTAEPGRSLGGNQRARRAGVIISTSLIFGGEEGSAGNGPLDGIVAVKNS